MGLLVEFDSYGLCDGQAVTRFFAFAGTLRLESVRLGQWCRRSELADRQPVVRDCDGQDNR